MSAPTLVTVRPGVTLATDAAASFQRIEAAAGRVDVNSSYRDWDVQMKLYQAYLAGSGVLALHPDRSMHCKGLAIDTDDVTLMRSTGDYGWRSTVVTEDWHFDYFRHLDKFYGQPVSGGSEPFPGEEDDMFTDEDRARLNAVYAALFGPANVGAPELKWQSVDGPRSARYGVLDISIHTQNLVAKIPKA